MEVRDLRNIAEACLTLTPGLNVLVGRNAQGKTSLLEAVGLLARGRCLGQALVTTAHPHWARRVAGAGRLFEVERGRVRAA